MEFLTEKEFRKKEEEANTTSKVFNKAHCFLKLNGTIDIPHEVIDTKINKIPSKRENLRNNGEIGTI